ncbi:MAG: MFS transporter [Pseudonocardia sp.]|uniref:MFS transporter n=1 Tax=unclassified Pseudonocardia TaxID=2619320 RepID=UPI00086A8C23|nr:MULTISPECIES: MFS transporter [unclassified Pseudonocardia]MBN9111226.1 MFS transporter [Pseudonocardia sp.]ODU25598.1 MAG: MFS transporter permease [Pseudonocardia sp. SCN 72-51]ODV02931.1 MAG: MFS transporter permease [Pseudonocardia sp. SCN 73-27]
MRRRAWLAVAAAMFCCGWGGNQFTPLLIMYRDAAGYSVLTVDAFLGAYVVGVVPTLLLAGRLCARRGRRPLMLAGTAASLLASVLLALGETGPVPIFAGRFATGTAVAIAMAVGSTWVKELSEPPYDDVPAGTGARRAALSLTLGFGLGAGVAGVLAQWGPLPMELPYIVHGVLTVVALTLLSRAPETVPGGTGTHVPPLRAARHPRFLRVVLPMAPWIFGSAGVAYAIMPQLVGDRLGSWGLAYSTLLTVATLLTGAAVQPIAKRLDRRTDARAVVMSMIVMSGGLAFSVVAAVERSPWLALGAAIVLGAAYGVAVVAGLLEIQRLARPEDLAGLTGVYYALAYIGFLLPTVLAVAAHVVGYPWLLGALVVIAVAGTVTIAASGRSHLPVAETSSPARMS